MDIRGGPQAAGAPTCQADGPRSADLHFAAAGVTMPTRFSGTPSGRLPTYTAVHNKPLTSLFNRHRSGLLRERGSAHGLHCYTLICFVLACR